MKQMQKIPSGALLTVSTGEYSDYTVQGVFRALKEIDADALRKFYLHISSQDFLAVLVRDGYLEPINSFEFYLSDNTSYILVYPRTSNQ